MIAILVFVAIRNNKAMETKYALKKEA